MTIVEPIVPCQLEIKAADEAAGLTGHMVNCFWERDPEEPPPTHAQGAPPPAPGPNGEWPIHVTTGWHSDWGWKIGSFQTMIGYNLPHFIFYLSNLCLVLIRQILISFLKSSLHFPTLIVTSQTMRPPQMGIGRMRPRPMSTGQMTPRQMRPPLTI